jgi:tRNA U34 5-carboxymethylaminomethyl modifying enzyme MnmG/GidA
MIDSHLYEIQRQVKQLTQLPLNEASSYEAFQQQLVKSIHEMIEHNFQQLVQILYRIDVDEKKLKSTLQTHPQQLAGELIADLIIQRIQQTFITREQYKTAKHNEENEEKW